MRKEMAREQCWHKRTNDEGFCIDCGVRAAIKLDLKERETDDYVAWLRWSGDEAHRHLVICDSDAPGAFRVYRRRS